MGGRSTGGPQRARGRMRSIAGDNHWIQAKRLRGLFPINTSFPMTARWKRRVPRGRGFLRKAFEVDHLRAFNSGLISNVLASQSTVTVVPAAKVVRSLR